MAQGRSGGPSARAYFILFYNTNFPINVALSLTVLLPLLIAEIVQGSVGRAQLVEQILATMYLSLLYAIAYVTNDVVDFRDDTRRQVYKASLISRTGSRSAGLLFLAWVLGTLVVVEVALPRLGRPLCCYGALILVIAAVHSYWRRAKRVTVFMQRAARFVAPAGFCYIVKADFLTARFLLSCVIMFPVMMDGAYVGYLKAKGGWSERARVWSIVLYVSYYGCCVFGFTMCAVLGRGSVGLSDVNLRSAVVAVLIAPVLLVGYRSYGWVIGWMSRLLPERLVRGGNPAYARERREGVCRVLVTGFFIGLLIVYACAR